MRTHNLPARVGPTRARAIRMLVDVGGERYSRSYARAGDSGTTISGGIRICPMPRSFNLGRHRGHLRR